MREPEEPWAELSPSFGSLSLQGHSRSYRRLTGAGLPDMVSPGVKQVPVGGAIVRLRL